MAARVHVLSRAPAVESASGHPAALSKEDVQVSRRVGPKAVTRRVLGVDPGTRVIGYGLIDVRLPARYDYVECGVLKIGHLGAISCRLVQLAVELRAIIAEFAPQELAIECAFHGINASSALKLAESRGAVKLVAAECGLSVAEYSPARIKRAVAGNGRAAKGEVQGRITMICGLSRRPSSDAADALAIALCHAQSIHPIGMPRRA